MALYSSLPQFEDIEIQRTPDQGGGAIQSITISKETQADGSIVRRKETLLSSGKTIVEEHVMAPVGGTRGPQHAGIRFLPATPSMFAAAQPRVSSSSTRIKDDGDSILPLRHRLLPSKKEKEICNTNDDGYGILFRFGLLLLILLIMAQIVIWYLLRSGQDLDTLLDIFQQQHDNDHSPPFRGGGQQ